MTNQTCEEARLNYASLAVVAQMQANAIEHEWIDWERIPIGTTELLKEKWARWNYYGGYDDDASLEVHGRTGFLRPCRKGNSQKESAGS